MGVDYQTAVRLSAGLGGGMYLGGVCGALSGGILAIGLRHGGAGPASMQTAILVRQFADRFRALHRSINCPDLIGFDLGGLDIANPETLEKLFGSQSTPADQEAARAMLGGRDPKALFAACAGYVRDAVTIVDELLREPVKGR